MLKVSVSFHFLPLSSRSDRKILDRVLRSKKFFLGQSACERTSCLPCGRPLHRLIIHSSAVSVSKFRMLTRRVSCWIRQLWSDQCSIGSPIALAFAAATCCGFPRSTCDFVPTLHGFVSAFFGRHLRQLLLFPNPFAPLSKLSSVVRKKTFRDVVFFTFLTEVPCQKYCPDLPLQTATCAVVSSNFFCWSFLPELCHMCKMIFFVSFTFFALNGFVDDHKLCEVSVSLITTPLCVNSLPYHFFDAEAVLLEALVCENLVK